MQVSKEEANLLVELHEKNGGFDALDNVPHRIKILLDVSPVSPRDDENFSTMVCAHRRYDFGDDDAINTLISDLQDSKAYCEAWDDTLYSKHLPELEELAVKAGFLLLPIYMYDHSAQSVKTTPFGCSWDSGKIGFIYVTPSQARSWFGWKKITKSRRDEVFKYLDSDIQDYDKYLNVSQYYYAVENIFGDSLDSCCGFYGDDPKENGMDEHLPEGWEKLEVVTVTQH